jgi:O-antigen/teichoic acid export membrane protein
MLSGQGVSVVFQAIYFVLIGRALGSSEYGVFAGVVALINVLSQFSSVGMEMVLVRNISRARESFAETWGKALFISTSGFIVILAAAMLMAHFTLKPAMRPLVPYIAVSDALLGKIAQLAGRAFQGAGKLAYTAKLTALTNIARALAALGLYSFSLLFHLHPTAYTWAKVYWLSSFVSGLIALVLVTNHLGWPRFRRIHLHELVDGFSYSLSSSAISVYNDIDKTLLAGAGQFYAAGIYSAAYRIIDVASAPVYAAYAAATPHFFRNGVRGIKEASAIANRLLRRTIPYGVAVAAGAFLVSPLLPCMFGPSFRGSAQALRWLCLLPLIRGLHYAWGTTITGSSSQWYRTATQIGAAACNLLLNLLLVPRWSWQGAAVASLLTDGGLAASNFVIVWWLSSREARRKYSFTTS